MYVSTAPLSALLQLHREGDVAIAKKNVADLGKALALQNKCAMLAMLC